MRKSKFSDNQGKCCDAALRILEERKNAVRTDLSFPEKEHHSAPIELVCTIGSERYALEHTKLEAYPKQMQDGVHFTDALEELETSTSNTLPINAHYMLVVPSGSFHGLKPKRINAIREKIKDWVIHKAQSLHPPRNRMKQVTEKIDGVPFQVTLQAVDGLPSLNGKLKIARFAPSDLEALRSSEIEQMLLRKLPKLEAWAANGTDTVLILESEDIALTNHQLVLDALKLHLPTQLFCPDYVFFVDASSSPWIVQTLVSEKQFPELPYQGWSYREFNVNELIDLQM
jgi:hypothetical protein